MGRRRQWFDEVEPQGSAARWFFRRAATYAAFWENDRRRADWIKGDPCVYCYGASATVDHIEPRSGGGSNRFGNFAAACRYCNSSKGSTPLLRFLINRTRVPWFDDRRILRPSYSATAAGRDPHGRLSTEIPDIWEDYG